MRSKSILQSKTFWGAVLAALPTLIPELPALLPALGISAATASKIITGAGAILAIYGRINATSAVHVTRGRTPPPALLLVAIALAVPVLGNGCASVPRAGDAIQHALDATLPPAFTGDARVYHKNPYIDVTIDAGNLRRENGRWVWDWLRYTRNGRVSTGTITLGPAPR